MSTAKFKNALGADQKAKFSKCAVTTVSTEGRLLAVNGNFLAMSWNNAGEIVVVDSNKPFELKIHQPRIKGDHFNILDLEFSPFSSDLLACSRDDYSVLLYKIPEGGLTNNITKEVQAFKKHTKKVPFVTFNPVASDVVCSGAFLGEILVWNAIKGETFCELKADDTPTLVAWNPNGTLIGATNKKKNINIFDVRANKMILKHQINDAFQAAKFAWANNEQFVTTSWNKAGAKMLKLWDIRKVKGDLTNEGEVLSEKIDTSKTVSTPFVDKESKLVYTIGKGEATIHIYDFEEGKFKKGIDFTSAEPSISSVMFDRKYLDYNNLEVDRFARYVNSQNIYYVSFTIPRRSSRYDPTLYPPVECGEAALSYDQWANGETAEPIKKEINTIENKFVSKDDAFIMQEVNIKKKTPEERIKELEGKITEISVKINQFTEENAKLKKQIEAKKGKKILKIEAKPQEKFEEPKKEENTQEPNQEEKLEENQQKIEENPPENVEEAKNEENIQGLKPEDNEEGKKTFTIQFQENEKENDEEPKKEENNEEKKQENDEEPKIEENNEENKGMINLQIKVEEEHEDQNAEE